jgi:uncharacterized lipoprotein YddW (UPF0748 family)
MEASTPKKLRSDSGRGFRIAGLALAALILASCAGSPPGRPVPVAPAAGQPLAPETGKPAATQPEATAPEAAKPAPSANAETGNLPSVEREFRGLWIASMGNIDWPAKKGLDAGQLASSASTILDRAAALGVNAVIFQARPLGDALYSSDTEPWSHYVSGVQGNPPPDSFDPLAFWIEAAHTRGIQLHAWINPFRVGTPVLADGDYSPLSIAARRPDLAKRIGKGYRWLDPGIPEARDYAISVVVDLISRYDLDGIVIDDYFYPSREYLAPDADFPDADSYAVYREGGGTLDLGDWRRDNIDRFVSGLDAAIRKSGKPILFGISPAGIWRPGNPVGTTGRDAFAEGYADSLRWLEAGWCDWFSPQLYWPIAPERQSYPLLLGFWNRADPSGVHLWPSLNLVSAKVAPERAVEEFSSQVFIERGMRNADPGVALYGAKALADPVFASGFAAAAFPRPSLVPVTERVASPQPLAPVVALERDGDGLSLSWDRTDADFRFVVYYRRSARAHWETVVLGEETGIRLADASDSGPSGPVTEVIVTAVSRTGTESAKTILTAPTD